MMVVARARPEAGPSGNEWWQTTEMRDPQSKPRMMESRTLLKGRDFYRPNGIRATINYAHTHLHEPQDKTEAPAKIHRQTHRVVTVCMCVCVCVYVYVLVCVCLAKPSWRTKGNFVH